MPESCKRCGQGFGSRHHLSRPENGGTIERTALPAAGDMWKFSGVPRALSFSFESTDATEWIEVSFDGIGDIHRVYANEELPLVDRTCRGCGEGSWTWTMLVVKNVSVAGAGATRTIRVRAV